MAVVAVDHLELGDFGEGFGHSGTEVSSDLSVQYSVVSCESMYCRYIVLLSIITFIMFTYLINLINQINPNGFPACNPSRKIGK